MTNIPVPGDEVFSAANSIFEGVEDVKRLLSDSEVTSARLVVNPEKMVVDEARRTYTYLGLFGYGVDGVVVNRVLPAAVDDPYFAGWRTIQAKHMETIISSFPDIPILPLRLFDEEMVGGGASATAGRRAIRGARPGAGVQRHLTLHRRGAGQ